MGLRPSAKPVLPPVGLQLRQMHSGALCGLTLDWNLLKIAWWRKVVNVPWLIESKRWMVATKCRNRPNWNNKN